MPEPRLPLTPAERDDLRQRCERETRKTSKRVSRWEVDRLLALLDEVERLETEVARLQKSAEAALGLMRFLP